MTKDIFQAIADPTRRAILALIAAQAMTPGNLAEHFDMSRQAVSKHIHILIESELLSQKKSGREIYYHFNPEKMEELENWLNILKNIWEKRFNQLDDLLKNIS